MGLPRRASALPLTAISFGLQAWERSRGLREFALRRGNEALQIAAMTPLGRLLPQQLIEDGADEEAARIAAQARAATAPEPVQEQPVQAQPVQAQPTQPARPASPPPAPKAPPVPPAAAKEVGAPGAVAAEVEKIADPLEIDAPTTRDDLPIPDFDNISIGSLRARLRNLSVEQLVVLREWEQAHANRLQVVTTLDNRIAKVGAEQARKDTGSDYPQEAVVAEKAAESEGGTLRV